MKNPETHFLPKYPGRPITELEAEITELAGHINAANHRFLTLIAEFDDRNGWVDMATQSCAHWLNWKCGIAMGAARERVRVAHALQGLPKISDSMSKGELSYSKVRALTRVATPATEDYLLMIALHGTASHVDKLVSGYRRVLEAEELSREATQRANRSISYYFDTDGSLVLNGRLTAEAGALFVKAMDASMNELSTNVPAGTSEEKPTWTMKRADAFALMAESFLQHGAEAMNGGDKHQIVVHVSAETLQHKEPGQCEFEDCVGIAAETARRLACDCSIVRIVEDEAGEPLNVGRKTRSVHPALRRALNARDKGCRFPGCSNKKYVDHHHIEHWVNGGETKPSNLITLCRFHHHSVHEGGWQIVALDDGAIRFLNPNGAPCDGPVRIDTDWTQLRLQNIKHEIHIDRDTAATRWRGESMDYGMAVQVLLQEEKWARNVSAGQLLSET